MKEICPRVQFTELINHNPILVNRTLKVGQWCRGFLDAATRASRPDGLSATSLDLCDNRSLRTVLGGQAPVFHSRLLPARRETIIGWGRKWSGKRAVTIAGAMQMPFFLLEDGFLRAAGRQEDTLSIVFDDQGIYYDAFCPSLIETLIAAPLVPTEVARAEQVMQGWRKNGVSKYNDAPEYEGPLPDAFVLVIDQVAGDLSVDYGMADAGSFQRMLRAALAEHPDATVVVKVHPDVYARAKKGYFDIASLELMERVCIIAKNCHPVRLIEDARAIYTVTSQVGFEALIWGKRVRTFGMPFYAGWGLSEDELPAPDRRRPVTIEQLVHSALVKYPRYIDPVTMERCEVERAIEYVGLQRRKRLQFPQEITAVGFSRWKRPFIEKFLMGSDVSFVKRIRPDFESGTGKAITVWGSAEVPNLPDDTKLLRIEDGFLRSSGLGADLVRPLSLVIDDVGIYYDATRPSQLEQILSTQAFDDEQRERARRLRDKIIDLKVTKYNLDQGAWARPDTQRRIILVAGQVETDASIRLGSPEVVTNIELLRRVRSEHPDAYVIYKPHPDIVAGLRRIGQGEGGAFELCDEILTEAVSTDLLLSQVDELHTMTSLMGFEALMRGVKVVCHGLPFYAGWGLTEDRIICPRRTRRLSLDELVYGALISYPRYFNYERNCFIEPEQAVDQLAAWSRNGPTTRRWHRRLLRAAIVSWLKLKGSRR